MRSSFACSVVLVAVLGCTGPAASPPDIRYGYDECAHCHMIIVEARYSAVARDRGGGEARFDDLGGLVAFLAGSSADWRVWVHGERGWVPAEEAWFLVDPTRLTPMGSGAVAFEERAAARLGGSLGVGPLTWDELRSALSGGDGAPVGARPPEST